ncbi:hypothetical protein GGR57DRAFT_508520 [Xylariaceae sp. FL1272]|nr:hypothetical protein GGR57DRAFT_508520 [Xylariaceae sp. FL1272]
MSPTVSRVRQSTPATATPTIPQHPEPSVVRLSATLDLEAQVPAVRPPGTPRFAMGRNAPRKTTFYEKVKEHKVSIITTILAVLVLLSLPIIGLITGFTMSSKDTTMVKNDPNKPSS